jgi:S-adenosylmethionine:tRNA ribosyltransferase-isomerase
MSEKIGVVPLPPYIARNQNSPDYDRDFDNARYETVYANPTKKVASAAPTAGLHFTPELIQTLKNSGHDFFDLTLHVGIGTFQPLKSDKVEDHIMHSEIYEIPTKTLSAMSDKTKPRLAVGTTSLRAMEDFTRKHQNGFSADNPVFDDARLFVYPPQKILSADAMITNFHLPRSTLMCLVAVFLKPESLDGIEKLKEIYQVAIDNKYNFYSYGDAMLIL